MFAIQLLLYMVGGFGVVFDRLCYGMRLQWQWVGLGGGLVSGMGVMGCSIYLNATYFHVHDMYPLCIYYGYNLLLSVYLALCFGAAGYLGGAILVNCFFSSQKTH